MIASLDHNYSCRCVDKAVEVCVTMDLTRAESQINQLETTECTSAEREVGLGGHPNLKLTIFLSSAAILTSETNRVLELDGHSDI